MSSNQPASSNEDSQEPRLKNVKIKCPECETVQDAVIEYTQPWATYVHECANCKYVIMESEWNEVADTTPTPSSPVSDSIEQEKKPWDILKWFPSDNHPDFDEPVYEKSEVLKAMQEYAANIQAFSRSKQL